LSEFPLPGTGAWTGTLAASILDMGFKKASIAVMLGVLIAGIIMGIVRRTGAGIPLAEFSGNDWLMCAHPRKSWKTDL
jgi:hypothetical protein